nr:hypothetical protein [Tanacetum cinerariifolium]
FGSSTKIPLPLSFTERVSAGVSSCNSSSGSLIITPFLFLVETVGAAGTILRTLGLAVGLAALIGVLTATTAGLAAGIGAEKDSVSKTGVARSYPGSFPQEEEESHVQAKDVQAKGIQYIRRYHSYKKKPQSESEARKNMIAYLKNTEGFKMAFFKGKTYDQIHPIFQDRFDANMRFLLKSKEEIEKEEEEIIKSINETPVQKAAKRRRLRTPISKKVPIVNYEIVMINNKPRFSTSKPTKFSDDYLFVTLKNMFEKTDAQDVIWRSQQTEHGQALVKSWKLLTSCGVHIITFTTIMFALLVEKKYPLSKFTLEQLVMARLQVEEESEMSLELLRFTRQQLMEHHQG